MKTTRIFCTLVLTLLMACNKDHKDPLEPRLYQYSEEGNDIASCLINNEVWRKAPVHYSPYESFGSLRIYCDSVEERSKLILAGSMVKSGVDVELIFYLNDIVIRNFSELKALEGIGIPLNDDQGRGSFSFGQGQGIPTCPNETIHSQGMLYIRHVSSYVNSDGNERYICSGTFGFDYTSPCWTYEVHHGRYDYISSGIIFL